jgi:aryl-alcohol dehydrogenase-like predicted oxidoreductase
MKAVWTKTCIRLGVSLLAYSPLGFGLLTGKYDKTGISDPAHKDIGT